MDLQDGYGDQIVESISGAISIGVMGANIEDSYPEKGFGGGMACLRSIEEAADMIEVIKALCFLNNFEFKDVLEEAAERIKKVIEVARDAGIPDFVVNARTDVLCLKPNPDGWTREMMVEEAVKRGKAYLAAGATSVFVWGGPGGLITSDEIKILVDGLQGRLAVKLGARKDDLSVKELADLGLCRISIGPSLLKTDADGFRKGATRILQGGKLWSEDS